MNKKIEAISQSLAASKARIQSRTAKLQHNDEAEEEDYDPSDEDLAAET